MELLLAALGVGLALLAPWRAQVSKGPPPTYQVITGRVVDEAGRPLDGARVTLSSRFGGTPPEGWGAIATTYAGERGAFEFRGDFGATLAVSAHRAGHAPSGPQPLGDAKEAEIRLAPGANLAGRLLLDPEIPAWQVLVALVGSEDPQLFPRHAVASDGSFFLQDEPAGRVSFCVFVKGLMDHPCLVVPEVELSAGATSRDPRLAAVDLRGRLRVLALDVLDPAGRPLRTPVEVLALPSSASASEREAARNHHGSESGSHVWFVVEKAPVDVRLVAEGYRPTWIADARDGAVRMQPLLAIRLRLARPPELRPGAALRPVLVHQSTRDVPTSAISEGFDERGEYACTLTEPGPYSLTFVASVQTPDGETKEYEVGVARPQLVEVRDDASAEQVFAVDAPEEALRRMR